MERLMIVVPAYNEEEALPKSLDILGEMIKRLVNQKLVAIGSKIVVVNDGSSDKTWEIIKKYHESNSEIAGINFSRNFGHQNAIIGGLSAAVDYGDIFITIDADLQDDVEAIVSMLEARLKGFDIVYGARNNRDTDTSFKKWTASAFYNIMKKIGVEMVPQAADYRLMSRRAVEYLLKYKERNLFLRGIVPTIGFPSTIVYYARKEREAGTTKYPLRKMLSFAWDGITSFSVVPMHFVLGMGIVSTLVSLFMLLYVAWQYFSGATIQGWSSLMVSIWFLGGVQLIGLSVIGEYVGKVFNEVKGRPRYIIKDNLLIGGSNDNK
ncbi:glycosyltransferase family 2 protein [Weissella paramesenteroides]|uniref:glycosyltransferase family 2 protein n=1 Tax=Weissella paramesenteroides TaxID=1249 RepID=UPI002402C62C|nr:glycosyltransferase family 2 protein [Weissella paramesenteroides]MDF8368005.1 glycosyltransferase family 2 protein [Weissella paramesenteroides]